MKQPKLLQDAAEDPTDPRLDRWRLVLGRYANDRLPAQLLGQDHKAFYRRMDKSLDYLYGREYRGRGLRGQPGQGGKGEPRSPRSAGSLDPSQLTVLDWLGEARELFPNDTMEVIERHALDRYGLNELVTDATALERMEPNQHLLRTLLTLRGQLHGATIEVARNIIRKVVQELRRKLESEIRRTLSGRLNQFRHSPIALAQNFDPKGTLRANLKNYDRERRKLVIEQMKFFERNTRRMPWQIILCVDQSGSMADSVIHSAVMAGILAGLPAFRVKLVVFDTSVVDLSEHVDDPVEMLMRVQLGGGTDIGKAIRYCAQLVDNPQRTVLVLVSDFCEGGRPAELIRHIRQLAQARVKLLGLASLDGQAMPAYDRSMAERLAGCGMEIAALTPQRLAQWLVGVIS